jgi:hypothetical protein
MTGRGGAWDRSAGRPSVQSLRAGMIGLLDELDEIGLFQAAAYVSMSLDVLDRLGEGLPPSGGKMPDR